MTEETAWVSRGQIRMFPLESCTHQTLIVSAGDPITLQRDVFVDKLVINLQVDKISAIDINMFRFGCNESVMIGFGVFEMRNGNHVILRNGHWK